MNNSAKLSTIYIVRHGETEWNVIRRLQGYYDSPLTQKGIEQIKQTSINLKHIKFDAIFSSDLLRARRTSEMVRMDRQLKIATRKVLRERAYGRFDGMEVKKYIELCIFCVGRIYMDKEEKL